MPRVRIASLAAASLVVCCPACGECVAEPASGSLVWESSDVERVAKAGTTYPCGACGCRFRPPTTLPTRVAVA